MPVAIDEAPWSKPSQFVVGLDIGTAHSSVTYAHLQQNIKPFNDRVTHWPSRVGLGGSSDAKTVSMLYYDSGNRVKAAGAAVATPATRLAASRNGWSLVRYFKLQMHPPNMIQGQNFNNLEGLPRALTVEKVYADMIRYMLDHTRDFFNQRNTTARWEQLAPNMTLVIAHPNGWGLKEQDRLRYAVALSGVMSEAEVRRRVYFVPEAEAAVHYVLWEKSQELQSGDEFIVCDAGGSTVDTTAYRVLNEFESTPEVNHYIPTAPKKRGLLSRLFRSPSSTERLEKAKRKSMALSQGPRAKAPIRLKELKASDCQPAGGVLVNETFIAWLKEQFFALPPAHGYNLDSCVQKAEESFEANCKREFRTSSDAPSEYIVEMSAAIQELGYPDGNIILRPEVVQGFFEDAVRMILESIRKQIAGTKAKYMELCDVAGGGAQCVLIDEKRRRGAPVTTRRRASLLRTPTSTHYGSNAVASMANTCSSEPTPCSPEPTPALRSQHLLFGANTRSSEPTPALRSQHPLFGANTALRSQHPLAAIQHCSARAHPRRFGPDSFPGNIPISIGCKSKSAVI
ncbi:heat shock protein 70 kDa 12A [Ceratobasidium sp. AG-Ba]|nr:heat shock protein 70 kDa 12A [Ceratobasidium sp. AG-Ba]